MNMGTNFFRTDTIRAFDRQTDGQRERHWQYREWHYMQSHGIKIDDFVKKTSQHYVQHKERI